MELCKFPCEKKGHIDLRVHHAAPDVQPPLPGLPQKEMLIPWPGVRRDGVDAIAWGHCTSCGAPCLVFPSDEGAQHCVDFALSGSR